MVPLHDPRVPLAICSAMWLRASEMSRFVARSSPDGHSSPTTRGALRYGSSWPVEHSKHPASNRRKAIPLMLNIHCQFQLAKRYTALGLLNTRWRKSTMRAHAHIIYYNILFLSPTFRPDLVDYSTLRPTQHIHNLNNAFDIAEKELGLPRLLDAEGALYIASLLPLILLPALYFNIPLSYRRWCTSTRWQVHHDIPCLLLSLLLQDEGRGDWGKEAQ